MQTQRPDETPERPHRARWRLVAALAAVALTLGACETTEGAGRDLENLGDNIEDAAADAKD